MMLLSINYDAETKSIDITENEKLSELGLSKSECNALVLESLATALGLKVKSCAKSNKILDVLYQLSSNITKKEESEIYG